MNFALPPTGTAAAPACIDAEQCRAWCAALPLSNPLQVQLQLQQQIQLLNHYTLAAATRLALLEMLREPVHFVQEESAKKFAGRALPLAAPEQTAFDATHGLWQGLTTGYLRVLDACLAGEDGLAAHSAQVCARALATLVEDQLALVRAGRQVDAAHWRLAHAVLAAAETLGVAATPVIDALQDGAPRTPLDHYAEGVLLHAASLHEHTPRQQGWVLRWARRWAGKLRLHAAPPPDSPALPLCVDLAGELPPSFAPCAGPGARWLDTAELRKSLKARLQRLAAGGPDNSPARLGLGEDCGMPACEEVLRRIYPRWVKGGIRRRHERHPLTGACRFVAGVDAIHYYLSGHQSFKPPGSMNTDELRRQREELATFGRIATRFEDEYSRDHGYQLENWELVEDWGMLDHSSGGLRLVRPLAQPGGRLGIGQLVAMQPGGTAGLLLGVVRWVQVGGDSLAAGIQLFPGKPHPVGVRGTGVMAAQERYRPAFLLPPVAALEQPASVVLPPGAFKPNRILEAWTPSPDTVREIKLDAVLDRGADFERVAYTERG